MIHAYTSMLMGATPCRESLRPSTASYQSTTERRRHKSVRGKLLWLPASYADTFLRLLVATLLEPTTRRVHRYCTFRGTYNQGVPICEVDSDVTDPLRSDPPQLIAAHCAAADPAQGCQDLGQVGNMPPCDVVYGAQGAASCVMRSGFYEMMQSAKVGWESCADDFMRQQNWNSDPPGGNDDRCLAGMTPVPAMITSIDPVDGSEVTRLGEDCIECPYPDRCDGNGCSEGSGGRGCAYCDNGANGTSQHYQSGAECKPCPDSQASNVIAVIIGIAVGAALCVYIWKISTVAFQDGGQGADAAEEGTAGTAALDEIEGLKGDAETVAEIRTAVATMSSTAIVSGIALPSLFKISITFSLPFGTPKILGVISSWISNAISIDMQFGNPECGMDTPDALTVFKMKFFLTHIGFVLFLIVLSLPATRAKHRLHATNARIAAYTVAVGGLVKSCASCIACTEDFPRSKRAMMMALPDEECWTSEHNSLAIFAVLFLVVYVIIIPVLLFCKARAAAADGFWSNDELQQYGWLVLKYKESRWYFEFVILFDKFVFVACAVFFAWERAAWLLIGFSIVATLIMLAFVACTKPYRSGDAEPAGCLGGKEDKMMMLSLILQLVSFVLTGICHNDIVARRDCNPGMEGCPDFDEEPLEGLSPGVEFLAAAVGLLVVVIQIGMVWWATRDGGDEEAEAPESPTDVSPYDNESVRQAESAPQQQEIGAA